MPYFFPAWSKESPPIPVGSTLLTESPNPSSLLVKTCSIVLLLTSLVHLPGVRAGLDGLLRVFQIEQLWFFRGATVQQMALRKAEGKFCLMSFLLQAPRLEWSEDMGQLPTLSYNPRRSLMFSPCSLGSLFSRIYQNDPNLANLLYVTWTK